MRSRGFRRSRSRARRNSRRSAAATREGSSREDDPGGAAPRVHPGAFAARDGGPSPALLDGGGASGGRAALRVLGPADLVPRPRRTPRPPLRFDPERDRALVLRLARLRGLGAAPWAASLRVAPAALYRDRQAGLAQAPRRSPDGASGPLSADAGVRL